MNDYKDSTPSNAFLDLDSIDMGFYDNYDGNSLLYLSSVDPDSAGLPDIYAELCSCHEVLTSCVNLLVFADVFLCFLLGCLMASIFSKFWRFYR